MRISNFHSGEGKSNDGRFEGADGETSCCLHYSGVSISIMLQIHAQSRTFCAIDILPPRSEV